MKLTVGERYLGLSGSIILNADSGRPVSELMANIDNIDVLFEVLGNDTRRRILQLLADEPRYFIQLSKDLGVSQQAVSETSGNS